MVNFVRYADDFIITGCSKELLENEVKPLVERFMLERGLQLSPEKTCITHIEQGFDFLGQNLRKYGGKLLIKPSKKNLHAFMEKVRGEIRSNRATKQEHLIGQLNPVIRGWAYYHRHIEAGSTFWKVKNDLWHLLWRWAKRRHPNKNSAWIANRYWHWSAGCSWCFATVTGSNAQRSRSYEVRLVNPSDIPIKRYVKVQSDANPFDPRWRRLLRVSQEVQVSSQSSSFIVRVFYRLRSRGAYTRLEPDDGKPSSPVLRGGSGSDAASLPDRNALPTGLNEEEVDRNFFFYQVPPFMRLYGRAVGTRQGSSLALDERAQYARP